MCVIWHIMMFENLNLPRDDILFEKTSLVVSYSNDILSFDRDVKDNIPNLIKTIGYGRSLNNFNSFKEAIIIINDLYQDISTIINNYDVNLKEIIVIILEGSHNWSIKEDRYKIGFKMLKKVINNDETDFDKLMHSRENTPGDPKKI